jgi:hypothetical protein
MAMKSIGVFGAAAAIALGAIACTSSGDGATTPTPHEGQPMPSPEIRAVPIAEGFVTALGTYRADKAVGNLADGADLSQVTGVTTPERLRLLISWFEATGYEQRNIACAETARRVSGTDVRCTFDFHALR